MFYVALGYHSPQKTKGIIEGHLSGVRGVSIDLGGLHDFLEKSTVALAMPGNAFLSANPNARPVNYKEEALLANNMKDYVRVRQTGTQPQAVVAIF